MKSKSTKLLGLAIGLCLFLAISSMYISTTTACQRRNLFAVAPSGDPETDTTNIQAAFDLASAAGPGSKVRLTAGTFQLCRPIVVVNFDGTFKGAGMDKTIILKPEGIVLPLPNPNIGDLHRLFLFYHTPDYPMSKHNPAYLGISDMTVIVKGKTVLWEWAGQINDWLNGFEIVGKYTGVEDDTPTYINTNFKRVRFEGEVGPQFNQGGNLNMGFFLDVSYVAEPGQYAHYYNPLYGTFRMSHCRFSGTPSGLVACGVIKDSTFLVYDNLLDGVNLNFLGDFHNTKIFIFSNTWTDTPFFGSAGVAIRFLQGLGWSTAYPPELSTLWIFGNTFAGFEDPMQALAILDFPTFVLDPPVTTLEVHTFCNKGT